MRFFSSRWILLFFAILIIAVAAAVGVLFVYLKSPAFNERARQYIIHEIEQRTGATVTLKNFEWSFWRQRFRLDDLTLHGLEAAEEAPLAHFRRIDIGLNFRTLFERKIDLFELTLTEPALHIIVSPDGKTNLPSPKTQAHNEFNFQTSVQNFTLAGGMALINERKINIDFTVKNLAAALDLQVAREVLRAQLRYDGIFDHSADSGRPIPYTMVMDFDYTRATMLAHRIVLTSGPSELKLQGKINQLLSREISGRLEYVGNVEVPFLNYFFTEEKFGGKSDVAGFLEFADGYFLTQGHAIANTINFDGWQAAKFDADYAYRYPERELSFAKLRTQLVGGNVTGNGRVENLPGPSRVVLNLDYAGVDAAALGRAYPWDPQYRIFSTMTGKVNGWFQGKFDHFEFNGHADLKSYTPPSVSGIVPFPLDGSTDFQLTPGQARVANGEIQFYSTHIKADGLIHPNQSNLAVNLTSSNLKDIAFLYSDANGNGSFSGTLTGHIAKPVLDGDFALQNYAFREWKIEQASGGARLDTATELSTFRNVRIAQGESQIVVNGTTNLSGSNADLQVAANYVAAQDLRTFVNRDLAGVFAGNLHIAELSPAVKLEGDLQAHNLTIAGYAVGDPRGHIRYSDPLVEAEQIAIDQDGSTAKGSFAFDRSNEKLKFSTSLTSLNLQKLYKLGLPDVVTGVIGQANVRGDGTLKSPNISGNGTIQNLSIHGEVFPQSQVELSSTGSKVNLRLNAGTSVGLTAQIDTAATGYPFNAQASFKDYSIEKIAGLSQGAIVATGTADLAGLLTDRTRLKGQGQIESANIHVQDVPLRTTKPFGFDFNSDRLNLTGVSLTGQATQLNVAGTIAFTERTPLNLDVGGQVDLALLGAASPEWSSNGSLNVQVRVTGTPQTPDLRGVAHFTNASFTRRGFFTSLVNVNGDLFFDQDRVTLNNMEGRLGGGTVRAQGTAAIQRGGVEAMNIRVDVQDVRFRYPEGLRTIANADLVLRGNWTSPLLEGTVKLQNLSYRSDFENFLALVTERNSGTGASPASKLRLALHIEGSRNITIQNQLADVEARIDVDLKGTINDPSLTGHVEASGGTLVFQGNRYRLTRGNIDFADPVRIDPVVDIEAESQVRDYRVILTVSGRGDKLHLNMRSDPPLPELEIVSLIAGGQTRAEIAGVRNTSAPTSEQLFQSGAASILSDLLQQRVGNRLGFLGSGHIRLEPFVVGAANNPGTRVTLSEQVTKDLSITYSQDLSSNRQDVINIEYFVTRNTSILASRDELGNFGLDIRLRRRLK